MSDPGHWKDTITRWECPRCRIQPGDARTLARPDMPPGTHTGCPERAVRRTYIAADALLDHPMFEGEGSIPRTNVRAVISAAVASSEEEGHG